MICLATVLYNKYVGFESRCRYFILEGNLLVSVVPPKDKDVEKKLGRLATEIMSSEGVPPPSSRDGRGIVGFKRIQAHKSGPFDFEGITFAQQLSSPHLGPIWCMRFSHCGQLLATAGQVSFMISQLTRLTLSIIQNV